MNDPMTSEFPIFESNQVLTAELLNALRQYLEGHARESRLRTLGTGIIAGMQVRVITYANGSKSIRVGRGVGIAPNGDLIVLERDYSFKYATESNESPHPDRSMSRLLKGAKAIVGSLDLDRGKGEGDRTHEGVPTGWRLMEVPTSNEKEKEQRKILGTMANDNYVVVSLETQTRELECGVDGCDDRGKMGCYEPRFEVSLAAPGPVAPSPVVIPRLRHGKDLGKFTEDLRTAIGDRVVIPNDVGISGQIHQDFWLDLGTTWNELVEQMEVTGYDPSSAADASEGRDRRGRVLSDHPYDPPSAADASEGLCLGSLDGSESGRQHFRGPLAAGAGGIERVERLQKKLEMLISSFDPDVVEGVKILPQDGPGSCSSVIPYYYKNNLEALRKCWASSGLRASHPEEFVHSYHDNGVDPLEQRHAGQNFYRIEGILNMDLGAAIQKIETIRKFNGLAFDIVAVHEKSPWLTPEERLSKQPEVGRRWQVARRAIVERLRQVDDLVRRAGSLPGGDLRVWAPSPKRAVANRDLPFTSLLPNTDKLRAEIANMLKLLADAPVASSDGLREAQRLLWSETAAVVAGLLRGARELASRLTYSPVLLGRGPQLGPGHALHVAALVTQLRTGLMGLFELHAEFDELAAVVEHLMRPADHLPETLAKLADLHPGLEHGAGVPRGGTFVIVHKQMKIVADYYLPYRWATCCDRAFTEPGYRVVPLFIEAGWSDELALLEGYVSTRDSLRVCFEASPNTWKSMGLAALQRLVDRLKSSVSQNVTSQVPLALRVQAEPRGEPQIERREGDSVPSGRVVEYQIWLVVHMPLLMARDQVAVTMQDCAVDIDTTIHDELPETVARNYHILASPGGTLVPQKDPGKWRYTPPEGFFGRDEFIYEVTITGRFGVQKSSARVTIHVLELEIKQFVARETEMPSVSLPATIFCDNDTSTYDFRVTGSVVRITGPGVREVGLGVLGGKSKVLDEGQIDTLRTETIADARRRSAEVEASDADSERSTYRTKVLELRDDGRTPEQINSLARAAKRELRDVRSSQIRGLLAVATMDYEADIHAWQALNQPQRDAVKVLVGTPIPTEDHHRAAAWVAARERSDSDVLEITRLGFSDHEWAHVAELVHLVSQDALEHFVTLAQGMSDAEQAAALRLLEPKSPSRRTKMDRAAKKGFVEAGKGAALDALTAMHIGERACEDMLTFLRQHPLDAADMRRGAEAYEAGLLDAWRDFEAIDPAYRERLEAAYRCGLSQAQVDAGLRVATISDERLELYERGRSTLASLASDEAGRAAIVDSVRTLAAGGLAAKDLEAIEALRDMPEPDTHDERGTSSGASGIVPAATATLVNNTAVAVPGGSLRFGAVTASTDRNLRVRVGWVFEPAQAKGTGAKSIRYEYLDGDQQAYGYIEVNVLPHPVINVSQAHDRRGNSTVLRLRVTGTFVAGGKLTWQLPEIQGHTWTKRENATEYVAEIQLAERPDEVLEYEVEYIDPRLPGCAARARGTLRWEGPRPEQLKREHVVEQPPRIERPDLVRELDLARDLLDLVNPLLETVEVRDSWARGALDPNVLPKLGDSLQRLRQKLGEPSDADAEIGEVYATVADTALTFVWASGGTPSDLAAELFGQIADDVGAHEALRSSTLQNRLQELAASPYTQAEFGALVEDISSKWGDR